MLTDQELQSLRNLGNEAEAAADEIERLRAALLKIEAGYCIDPRTVARDALGPNARLSGDQQP